VALPISVLGVPERDLALLTGPSAESDDSITAIDPPGTTPLPAIAAALPSRTSAEIPIAGARSAAPFNPTFAAPARGRSPAFARALPRAAAANAS
jgi:hypothetical protein